MVLQSARGPVPNLAECVAGEPIRGSWRGHPCRRTHQSRPNRPPGKPSSPLATELAEQDCRVEAAWRALIADTPLPVVRAGAITGFGRQRIYQIENPINRPRGDNT